MNGDVEQYIRSKPEGMQAALREVRAAIRQALPEAQEEISYGMPAYRVGRQVAIYFAAWKKHYSVYPVTAGVAAELARHPDVKVGIEKGTARFSYGDPVATGAISAIAGVRAAEVQAGR
jgi:uncharacterized protein YdhG (YjbR/CyaY superfamily)